MKKLAITIVIASFALSGCAVVQYVGETAWETKHFDDCQPSLGDPIGIDPPGCNVQPPIKDEDEPKSK